nr:hypothetical protein [Chloroflexaceae bacterium]
MSMFTAPRANTHPPPTLTPGDDATTADTAHRLAALLRPYRSRHTLVLALPPDGLALASTIASILKLPLDVLVSREFGVPGHPTLVAGALSEGGGLCFNAAMLRMANVEPESLWEAASHTRHEVQRLSAAYRRVQPPLYPNRHTVLLVDGGLGSGMAQLAAMQALRYAHVHHTIVATPHATSAAAQLVARRAESLMV